MLPRAGQIAEPLISFPYFMFCGTCSYFFRMERRRGEISYSAIPKEEMTKIVTHFTPLNNFRCLSIEVLIYLFM